MIHTFAGPHNGGLLAVNKIDATPDGNKILALGNWTTVDGLDRDLLVLLDTSGATSVVSTWQTSFFAPACSHSFDTYMRDLDISPDGTYAVVTTTGAYGGVTSPCDTQTRWDLTTTASNLKPVWTNVTGGDTTYAVAISGPVVYVGGHFRWANNPYAGDSAGPGAVPRQGIAALDANTGLPLSWNPGRDRGVGVFDLLATSTGLWVGDDTNQIGGETHKSLAFFPLAGGSPIPANSVGTVPNDVYLLGSPNVSSDPSVLYRINAAGPAIPSVDDGPDWAADQTDPSPYRNSGSSIASLHGHGDKRRDHPQRDAGQGAALAVQQRALGRRERRRRQRDAVALPGPGRYPRRRAAVHGQPLHLHPAAGSAQVRRHDRRHVGRHQHRPVGEPWHPEGHDEDVQRHQ